MKEIVVDMLEFKQYQEVDIDIDPCIFLDCGHIKTLSTLDGFMDMSSHYDLSPNGEIISIKALNQPLPNERTDVKSCPDCRGSLRSICRYGRIVRRAILWETHQKFMGWVNSEDSKLSAILDAWESRFHSGDLPPISYIISNTSNNLHLSGPPGSILNKIWNLVDGKRYKNMQSLWGNLMKYLRKTRREEQPFQRVFDHVKYSCHQSKNPKSFAFDNSIIQFRGQILAFRLIIRCTVAILTDFFALREKEKAPKAKITVNFDSLLRYCENLITLSRHRKYPKYEIEGYLFVVRLCVLARRISPIGEEKLNSTIDNTATRDSSGAGEENHNRLGELKEHNNPRSVTDYFKIGNRYIDKAQDVLNHHSSCQVFGPEIDAVRKSLRNGTFYELVSAEERKAISLAMKYEFRGSGHWYACANGHPFTIGECGMPMEQARCPECGERIGGTNHTMTEGVNRDESMENITDLGI